MRKKIWDGIAVVLYICGFLVFAWPDLNSVGNTLHNQKVIEIFDKQSEEREESGQRAAEEKHTEAADQTKIQNSSAGEQTGIDLNGLYTAMQEYNRLLYETGQADLKDPWSYQQSALDLSAYGLEEQVIGVIEIPVMDIELPIYLGARKENLAQGAALLGQTSFPVGGENSNSVIAGHRGWKGIPMFREIERLKIGDTVRIRNFWETLTYEVTEIRVVLPEDIQEILIRPGKSMVTLITCHPYTQNYRRYVVFCERVDTDWEKTDTDPEKISEKISEEAAETGENLKEPISKDGEYSTDQFPEEYGEDQEVLQREKRIHTVGYFVLILLGVVIFGKIFSVKWKNVLNKKEEQRKG